METRTPQWRMVLLPATFALVCIVVTVALMRLFGGSLPFAPESYRVRIPLTEATNLVSGSGVQIAGVKIGKVVDVNRAGNSSVATIELQPQYAPLRTGATAIARTKTLLGEGYIELAPGPRTAQPIPDGGEMSSGQVQRTVQLDEFLQTFNPATRARLRQAFVGVADAFGGQTQALNDSLGNAAPFTDQLNQVLGALDQQRTDLGSMVSSLGTVLQAVGGREQVLRSAVTAGDAVLGATASRNRELAATIDALPGFLDHLRAASDTITADSPYLLSAVNALTPVAPLVAPALRVIDTAAPAFRGLFSALPATLRTGTRALPSLDRIIAAAKVGFNAFYPTARNLVPFMQLFALNRLSVVFAPANLASDGNGTFVGPGGRVLGYTTGIPSVWNETFAGWTHRLPTNRDNPYPTPPYGLLKTVTQGVLDAFDCRNIHNPLWLPPTGTGAPPCFQQKPWTFDGVTAMYPRLQLSPP